MTAVDARPPRAVVRVTNPLLGAVLRTRLGAAIPALALVRFTGRRSGRPRHVVVGWHDTAEGPVVVTPAAWRGNFQGGRAATVDHAGHRSHMVGTLDTDPDRVAGTVASILNGGTSPRMLGMRLEDGARFEPDDVAATGRLVVRFGAGTGP